MATTYGLDAPRVTEDEACELMLHHLALAAMYFEAAPSDDNAQALAELKRTFLRDVPGRWEPPAYLAAKAFVETIGAEFKKLEEDD